MVLPNVVLTGAELASDVAGAGVYTRVALDRVDPFTHQGRALVSVDWTFVALENETMVVEVGFHMHLDCPES